MLLNPSNVSNLEVGITDLPTIFQSKFQGFSIDQRGCWLIACPATTSSTTQPDPVRKTSQVSALADVDVYAIGLIFNLAAGTHTPPRQRCRPLYA